MSVFSSLHLHDAVAVDGAAVLADVLQTVVVVEFIVDSDVPSLLMVTQNTAEGAVYPLLLIVLAVRQVKADDGILLPLLLLIIYIYKPSNSSLRPSK